jgi:acyl-CoA synthetase (AMP-forming)/AMP-acid ligase II
MYGRDHLEFVERAVPGLASERRGVIRRPEAPYLRSVVALGDTDRAWATPVSSLVPSGVPPVSDELLTAVGAEVVPADEMLVVFTSGSTGEPKAVVHTHGNYFRKTALLPGGAPPPGSCGFVRMPFFWVGGLLAIGSALQHGSTIVCQERPDAGLTLELIERTRATDVIGWKGSSGRLVDHPDIAKRDVSSVPWLVTPRDPNRDQRLRHSTLGMTETMGSHAAGPRPGAPEEEQGYPLPERLRGSYGAPMPGMRHKVVDPDTGDVLPEGEEGEICVRGLGLMAGMYKRERADVFDRDGWYHTGDRGSFRDGYLFFTGRLHTMIKTGGANVSPEEVEDVLNAIPTVERAVVVGLPDPERDELVVAVVVPRPTDDFDVDALRAVCVEQLSTYKVPRRFVVMALDEVPWLPGGKPDREALVEKLLAC